MNELQKRTLSIFICVLLALSFISFIPITANATACNTLPPWGIGIGLCDFVGCCNIVSILNVFNFFNLANILGIVFNGCSFFNYSVECGWNFLSYPIFPCTVVNCGNIINCFSGRIVLCNLINVMSGLCNFGNIFNIASGSCINVMNAVTIVGSLFPPCIATGGLLNIGTGCNPCNPCLPACLSTGLTDLTNVLFLPVTIILSAITALLTPFLTMWTSVLAPTLTGTTYQQMGSMIMGIVREPLPACGYATTKVMELISTLGIKELCFLCLGIIWGILKKTLSVMMGVCRGTGLLDSFNIMEWLSDAMAKYLPMKMSLEGK